jgi:hypothetical protein
MTTVANNEISLMSLNLTAIFLVLRSIELAGVISVFAIIHIANRMNLEERIVAGQFK